MSETETINLIVKKTTENVFEILRNNGFEIKEKKTTFQKTEQLLYLIPKLKEAIKHNKNKINDLKTFGIVPKQSGIAVHIVPTDTPVKQDEDEIVQKEINKLKQRNHIINSQIKWVNEILETFKSDKFYNLIDFKYFKNQTREELAEYFNCDVKTISRNRNRIINELKYLLFPSDSIEEIGC